MTRCSRPSIVAFAPELAIVSPGYRPDHVVLAWAAERGIPIWGDIELAWRLRDKVGAAADWIRVTGTNGKTTTVQLATHMLAADGRRVARAGNIGIPVLDAIRDPRASTCSSSSCRASSCTGFRVPAPARSPPRRACA